MIFGTSTVDIELNKISGIQSTIRERVAPSKKVEIVVGGKEKPQSKDNCVLQGFDGVVHDDKIDVIPLFEDLVDEISRRGAR
jgi:hypothetical protein